MSTKQKISNVTVVCIDTLNIGSATVALKKTLEQIEPTSCKFLTSVNVSIDGVETIIIPEIKSVDEYSRFCIKELYKYIDTDFLLLIQHDGYVINGDLFDEKLYLYDYCGALWTERDGLNNGNGGMSWRSKKLCETIAKDNTIEILTPEDVSICRIYRRYLEGKYGLKWATDEIANRFSFELIEPNRPTFAFHGYFHAPYKETVVIQREGALGDVISVEPVLEYFYNKGYRVVLNTSPQFKDLFRQHHYRIDFFDEFDYNRIPYKFINLDMSYESNPKQVHLKSYYEFAGIKDGEIKSPKLNLYQNYRKDIKLFERYVIIHIDDREQEYRNIKGIYWESIVDYLKLLGYDVLQVGTSNHKIKGALKINTPSLQFLMWVVASSDLFIGIDSGISHIASGFNIPSIIFFGSVNPEYIHPTNENKYYIYNKNVCDKPFCWHESITTTGQKCYIDNENPPCSIFTNTQLINSINKLISNDKD